MALARFYTMIQVATVSKSKAILAFTSSGSTVTSIAKLRPQVRILAGCYDIDIARKLAIVWGVYPFLIERPEDGHFEFTDELKKATKAIEERGFMDEDGFLTTTAGLPFGVPGTTNVVRVLSSKGPNFWFDIDNSSQMRDYDPATYRYNPSS
jgi:pyruvate kinase